MCINYTTMYVVRLYSLKIKGRMVLMRDVNLKVEGAENEEGRTPSIWDTFAHEGRTSYSSFPLFIFS